MSGRAPRQGARDRGAAIRATIPGNGGFTFAERPEVEAPDARILWRAEFDPGTLQVRAASISPGHPDAIDPDWLKPWLTVVAGDIGEHVVLSDGWRHIRIDVERGSLAAGEPVAFEYHLRGLASVEPKLLPLRRLVDLCRKRRFSVSLYPPDRRIDRWILALRVHDAIADGASQRDIARELFGDTVPTEWQARRADSLRSRVRRLTSEARRLAAGGYRSLLRRDP